MYNSTAQDVQVAQEPKARKRWTVATARQNLPKLLAMAAREPQAVYRRDKLVATVVNPTLGAKVADATRAETATTLADDLAELRRLCADEDYTMRTPKRVDRGVVRRKRKRTGKV